MQKYMVVIPNRYPDVIAPLIESIKRWTAKPYPVVVIANGHHNGYGFWRMDYPPINFVYAKAVNYGIRHYEDCDIILLNDDCVLLQMDFFDELSKLAYIDDECGILSPLIKGGVGNKFQYWYDRHKLWAPDQGFKLITGVEPVCFPCVYLKRKMIKEIGALKETIPGYGGDDNEYCIRAREYGWKTAITSLLTIQHGDGGPELHDGCGKTWSVSFARNK